MPTTNRGLQDVLHCSARVFYSKLVVWVGGWLNTANFSIPKRYDN